jgi:hypothetical protein
MGPKSTGPSTGDVFKQPLVERINIRHLLVRLADVMDWDLIHRAFGSHFVWTTGRPALTPRWVAGLLYLQHAYDCSDEARVNTWVEHPYF